MTQQNHSQPYIISSPIDLLKVILQINTIEDHHLFYLGLGSPSDIENSCGQDALDVARNPLIALYFACVDNSPFDGEILIYQVHTDQISRPAALTNNEVLMLTERGTYVFVNDYQNDPKLLAKDKVHQKPIEVIVNKDAKRSIISELDKFGISTITLFPEMA